MSLGTSVPRVPAEFQEVDPGNARRSTPAFSNTQILPAIVKLQIRAKLFMHLSSQPNLVPCMSSILPTLSILRLEVS